MKKNLFSLLVIFFLVIIILESKVVFMSGKADYDKTTDNKAVDDKTIKKRK